MEVYIRIIGRSGYDSSSEIVGVYSTYDKLMNAPVPKCVWQDALKAEVDTENVREFEDGA